MKISAEQNTYMTLYLLDSAEESKLSMTWYLFSLCSQGLAPTVDLQYTSVSFINAGHPHFLPR